MDSASLRLEVWMDKQVTNMKQECQDKTVCALNLSCLARHGGRHAGYPGCWRSPAGSGPSALAVAVARSGERGAASAARRARRGARRPAASADRGLGSGALSALWHVCSLGLAGLAARWDARWVCALCAAVLFASPSRRVCGCAVSCLSSV